MAKKKAEETTDEAAKGGKLKLMIGAVVLVVAGAVIGSKLLAGGGAAAADAMGPTTTTTEPPGVVTSVESITLNLSDGRFLKLGLAFEVRDGEDYPSAEDLVGDEMSKGFAREVDAAISIMSSFTFEELISPNGKDMAKRTLLETVQEISDDAIKNVLFHEFVMQ